MRLRPFYRVQPNKWLLTRNPTVRAAQLRAVTASHETEAELEEYVRQWVLRELIDTYGYPAEWLGARIVVEDRIPLGTTVQQADVSLRDEQGNTVLFVEVRASEIDTAGLAKAQQQLESYLKAVPTATVGMLTSAVTTRVIRRSTDSEDFEVIADIPGYVSSAPPQPRPSPASPVPPAPTAPAAPPESRATPRRTRSKREPLPEAAPPAATTKPRPETDEKRAVQPSAEPGLTTQLFMTAALQAKAATEVEAGSSVETSPRLKLAHRSYVVGAILQAIAALEGEIWTVVARGPGYHLGRQRVDEAARQLLTPLESVIDEATVLERYQLVLHVLQKERMDPGSRAWQDAALAVRLRREIVRHRPEGDERDGGSAFVRAIRSRNLPPPPFASADAAFFPDQCLSAACAQWVVRSGVEFVGAFYDRLGFPDPLAARKARLASDGPSLTPA